MGKGRDRKMERLSEIERQRESQQTENGNRRRLRHRKSADKARGKEKKTHSHRGSRRLGGKEGQRVRETEILGQGRLSQNIGTKECLGVPTTVLGYGKGTLSSMLAGSHAHTEMSAQLC